MTNLLTFCQWTDILSGREANEVPWVEMTIRRVAGAVLVANKESNGVAR